MFFAVLKAGLKGGSMTITEGYEATIEKKIRDVAAAVSFSAGLDERIVSLRLNEVFCFLLKPVVVFVLTSPGFGIRFG
jgi:hypothetical protein